MTSTLTQPQTTRRISPLDQYDHELLAIVIEKSEEQIKVSWDEIYTIRIDENNTVWVHLYDGKQLPFDRDAFKEQVELAKGVRHAREVAARFMKQCPARELREGDRIVHDGKTWTVEICRRSGLHSHGNYILVRFDLFVVNDNERKHLQPYSEGIFHYAA